MYPLGRATEGHLECIRICDVKLFVHHDLTSHTKYTYPSCGFFTLLNCIIAVVKTKPVNCLGHYYRQNFFLVSQGSCVGWSFRVFGKGYAVVLAAVNKKVFLSAVPVNVNKEMDFSALQCFFYHFLHRLYLRAHLYCWILPLTI